MIGLVCAALLAAPPALPKLSERGAVAIQAGWEQVKDTRDPAEQASRMARAKLLTARCNDTLDVRELMRLTDLPLRLRDTWRWRTVARPEMIAVIAGAARRLRETDPDAEITIGDLAQQGCGQIRYGTVVELLDEVDVEPLRERAQLLFGELTVMEPMPPEQFVDEWPRFDGLIGPIWVETRFTGRTGDDRVRVETRRFTAGDRLGSSSVVRLIERTRKRVHDRRSARYDTVRHTLEDGRVVKLRRVTWTDPRAGRWMEAIFRPTRSYRVDRFTLLRVREAVYDYKKPTSPKYEERYHFGWDDEASMVVTRHYLEYEAHHTSHVGGLDADLSYVTSNNEHHFNPVEAILDPEATWRWLSAISDAAASLGVPLKALFIDRAIERVLRTTREGQSRRHPLWRKLRRSPGHDSHVHVRLGASPRFAGRDTREILKRVGLPVEAPE